MIKLVDYLSQPMKVKKIDEVLVSIIHPLYPLKNVEIEGYNENKQRFNGVYSRDNLLDKTDFGAYIVNLQDSLGPGTH